MDANMTSIECQKNADMTPSGCQKYAKGTPYQCRENANRDDGCSLLQGDLILAFLGSKGSKKGIFADFRGAISLIY